jgi:hypothetical protein
MSRFLGKWNVLDASVLGVLALAATGVLLVQSGFHVTSGQVVDAEKDIAISVQIPMLKTLDPGLFKAGEQTSITIRNQPRGEVAILSAKHTPVQVALPGAGGAKAYDDPTQRNSYDFLLTLKDHAKQTKDGYVTEGVKVKVGLPIELEGFKYRVYGKIVDVNPL